MPKVTLKNGEIVRFAYSPAGRAKAKLFAASTGGTLQIEKNEMGRNLARKYKKSKAKKTSYA